MYPASFSSRPVRRLTTLPRGKRRKWRRPFSSTRQQALSLATGSEVHSASLVTGSELHSAVGWVHQHVTGHDPWTHWQTAGSVGPGVISRFCVRCVTQTPWSATASHMTSNAAAWQGLRLSGFVLGSFACSGCHRKAWAQCL